VTLGAKHAWNLSPRDFYSIISRTVSEKPLGISYTPEEARGVSPGGGGEAERGTGAGGSKDEKEEILDRCILRCEHRVRGPRVYIRVIYVRWKLIKSDLGQYSGNRFPSYRP